MIKRRVIVDYKNVPEEVLHKLAEKYPHGYTKAIIKFTNAKNELVSAVPIELGDTAYLVKVSTQLQKMVDDYDADDFDDLGIDAGGTAPKGAFNDEDEFGSDDDDGRSGYSDDDDEESLDDHLDEAENIADDEQEY
jgi:DNA-directed RNA polymerase subunit delta